MNLPRIVLLLSALAFLAFGVAFFLQPEWIEDLTGLQPTTASAAVEVRAMYGGLELGMAAFLFWCASRPERFRAGLAASLFCFLGLAAGRLGGALLAEGDVTRAIWLALAAEVTATVLAWLALSRLEPN